VQNRSRFKTPEQWKAENPSAAKTLVPTGYDNDFKKGSVEGYKLNQRFIWEIESNQPVWHILYKREDRIVDIKTESW
jgi:tRNA(Phe) wybutosine-synthesizing methylase Tyw3